MTPIFLHDDYTASHFEGGQVGRYLSALFSNVISQREIPSSVIVQHNEFIKKVIDQPSVKSTIPRQFDDLK